MALLLAFDTATPHLAVVLADGARLVAWREDPLAGRSHAEKLNIFIAEVMDQAGRKLQDLEAVAVGTGPGSYTGLRIGLSAAKGFCFALNTPLIGMGTLEVLLAQYSGPGAEVGPGDVLMPMVDARRMEVYTRACAPDGRAMGETAPLVLDEAWCEARDRKVRTHVFGDGADKAAALWKAYPWIRHAPGVRPGVQGLARCAGGHFQAGRFSDLAGLVPEYGKPANVAQKRGRE